jgi:hypothetical protein
MTHLDNPIVNAGSPALAEFGGLLRSLRIQQGLSQAAVARHIPVHCDLIAKIEKAVRWPSAQLADVCDELLLANGQLRELWPTVDKERRRLQLDSAHARITRQLGITTQRPVPKPERVLLGTDTVVITTPLKREETRARPVVAVEDMVGAQRLAAMAQHLGLHAVFETVPLGGQVDLNRPNLVVICGPRLSPAVAATLRTDPDIHFRQDRDGVWTLLDLHTRTSYRSGQDSRPASSFDVAYLGRLPRPDRAGSLLIFTGIHPQGSLGVVHLLSHNLAELHSRVQNRYFSVLVRTRYRDSDGEPEHVDLLTPIYQRTGVGT